jgi:hypothetical protein
LLTAAAEALDAGVDPFRNGFLTDNEVTIDECMSLAQQLAIGARVVAKGLDTPRSAEGIAVFSTLARGVSDG